MKTVFYGVGVALVTPFVENNVDYFSLENLINRLISQNVKAIIILATTGESSTISDAERTDIIKFCVTLTKGKVKLVVGTGNNDTKIAIERTIEARLLGADAVLAVSPYYNKTTQQGIIDYYNALARVGIPIIMYNVPARTGLNIELDTIRKIIKQNPMIYGIKESTTDIVRIMDLMRICKNRIAVYSGEDDLNHIFYLLGGSGCISVTANILPNLTNKLFSACISGDIKNMNRMQNKLHPINTALFYETNPIPIKYALFLKNHILSEETRPPLIEMSKKNKKKMSTILRHF